ncbi:uncharacterized protein LOC105192275 [Harpegnathos saltator]|uniref:uncharacterized protein LOC105192275 n=1 Tax=Harpegnathos saltator TaxID=610380 RepID=UPI00058C47B2|nr:uncharacterized protein LOC105192275 [Harpegnathos saltator]
MDPWTEVVHAMVHRDPEPEEPLQQRTTRKRGAAKDDTEEPADLGMVGQAGQLEAEKVRRVMPRGSPPTTLSEQELEDAPPLTFHANLSRSRRAQYHFAHGLRELETGLGLVSKPFWIPISSPDWIESRSGGVVMVAHPITGAPPCKCRKKGDSCVAVDWGPVTIVGVYLHPRKNKAGLGELPHVMGILDEVGDVVRQCHLRPVVVAGDFNAHSTEWGCSPGRGIPEGATP